MQFRKLLIGAIAGFCLAIGGYLARAQQPPAPVAANLHQQDLLQFAPLGFGTAAEAQTPLGIAATMMVYGPLRVPLTGFTLTGINPVVGALDIINPAGTLATGTLTMPPNPNDGGNYCFMSTQTQTALTVTANTGQTVGGTAVSALVAYVPVCWRWIAVTATWARTA